MIRQEETVTIETEWDNEIGFLEVFAMWNGRQIGHANCWKHDYDLELVDVVVQNALPIPRFRGFLKPSFRDFRNLGIGSRILNTVVEAAKEASLTRIYGRVVKRDRDNNPKLLSWYQRHGFVINSDAPIPESQFIKDDNQVVPIILDLDSPTI